MKLEYALYIVMLSSQLGFPVLGQEAKKTYRITDKVLTCSSWLSSLINNFCDNVYKIVKRDTSLLIDKLTPKALLEHSSRERMFAEERWQRVRRQVANECCIQPCTVANVIRYCPDNARLIRERPDIFDY